MVHVFKKSESGNGKIWVSMYKGIKEKNLAREQLAQMKTLNHSHILKLPMKLKDDLLHSGQSRAVLYNKYCGSCQYGRRLK